MEKEKIIYYTKYFKNNKAEWIRDLWKICNVKFNKLIALANEKGIIINDSINEGKLNFFFSIYTFIISLGIVENKYLIITPPVKKEDLYKEYKGTRQANLNRSSTKDLIDSFLLSSFILLGHYNSLIIEERVKELIERGEKFSGKKVSEENKEIYLAILELQDKLRKEHGNGQIVGLTNSVRQYSKVKRLNWDKRKIKSTSETIRKLLKDKKLP